MSESAERKRVAREAARRREATNVLRIIEATAGYAAGQVGSGCDPGLARAAALEAAAEMELAAAALRRLTRLGPAERRSLARMMAGQGMSRQRIAATVGVSDRSVRSYVNAGERPVRRASK